MRAFHSLIGALVLLMLCSTGAAAQPDPEIWRRGTTLNVFGGAAFNGEPAPLIGAGLGWEIVPRLSVEGSGAWLGERQGVGGFSADVRALFPLVTARPVAPFLAAGVGLHRATFDRAAEMPEFYRHRLAGSPERVGRYASFTDPTLVFGGGVDLFVTRALAVRPDLTAAVLLRDGRTRTAVTAAVHLAYHFEEHLVVPARRARR